MIVIVDQTDNDQHSPEAISKMTSPSLLLNRAREDSSGKPHLICVAKRAAAPAS